MVDVASRPCTRSRRRSRRDLRRLVLGPDGAPYVLDAGTKTVYRVDLANRKAVVDLPEAAQGRRRHRGTTRSSSTVGGQDILIVDAKNIVWRWRAANSTGKGTTTRVRPVTNSAEWGNDILGDRDVHPEPRQQPLQPVRHRPLRSSQILRYSPAADGNGYPAAATNWLATARDVSDMTAIYVDGDIWLAEGGNVLRLVNGKSEG